MATLRGETGAGPGTEGGGNQEQGTREGGVKGEEAFVYLGLADVDIMV